MASIASQLKSGGELVYVPVIPESYCEVQECFPNVEKKVRRDGGEMVVGWQFWKETFITEGEFHAVWRSDDGKLRDVTPKPFPLARILFLQDDTRQYNGERVDNIRVNTTGKRLGDDLIRAFQAKSRIENRGEYASLRCPDYEPWEKELLAELVNISAGIMAMLLQNRGRGGPCFCRSGVRYKDCHGKDLGLIAKRVRRM